MERLQDRFQHWMGGKTLRTQRSIISAALAVLAVTAALGSLLGRNPISITVGSLCGLAMALLLRQGFTLLPAGAQERWNLKARLPFTRRRWLVGLLVALVVTTLIGVGQRIPYALGGAVTVCAFILLALLFLPTMAEVDRMEQQTRDAAEASEKAAAATDWDGFEGQDPPPAGPDRKG